MRVTKFSIFVRYIFPALCLTPFLAFSVTAPENYFDLPAEPPQVLQVNGAIAHSHYDWPPPISESAAIKSWQTFSYSNTGCLAAAVGKPIKLTADPTDLNSLKDKLTGFYHSISRETGFGNCDFEIIGVKRTLNSFSVQIVPTCENIRIYGAYAVFSLSSDGSLTAFKARGFGGNFKGSFSTDPIRAAEFGLQELGIKRCRYKISKTWLPLIFGKEIALKAVYEIQYYPDNPEYRPALFIDAETEDLLAAENRIFYDRIEGEIRGGFKMRYGRDEAEETIAPFVNQWIQINNINRFTHDEGNFSFNVDQNAVPVRLQSELRGRWVNVDYEDGRDAFIRFNINNFDPLHLVWNDNNSRVDERGLYYHTNFIHGFWKELDPDFDGLDYPVPATCMVRENFDNAFWNGHGMYFGDGGQMDNFALYADIIYHEYGHGVTQHIYENGFLPYEDESGALNEAWSDYFPCSITDEPLVGEGGLRGNNYIRNIDNDYVYPDDIRGEVHLDSRIISAAMWRSRQELGRDLTDPLFHYSRYHLGSDFLTYFIDVLITDDDDGDLTNGTPHSYALYDNFGRHGIGPGVVPDLQITSIDFYDDELEGAEGNDNGLWEPGEVVRFEIELFRDDFLYPPEAENVEVEVRCEHPRLNFIQSEARYGDINAGDARIGDIPFLFEISEDANVSFATFYIDIVANNGRFEKRDSLRVTIGHPSLMVVHDGEKRFDKTEFINASLDSLDQIYWSFSVKAPFRSLAERLSQFETVLWSTGSSIDSILESSTIDALSDFLDSGGNLFMTGQSAASVREAELFLAQYMGVVSVIDSVSDIEMRGAENDPVGSDLWLLLVGNLGARNQVRPGVIEAIYPAVETHRWVHVDGNPACGVRREDPNTGSKTVFFSFGLESVSGAGPTDPRERALAAVLNWLDIPVSVNNDTNPDECTPIDFQLMPAFPNPFNPSFQIPVQANKPGNLQIQIYDIHGRRVYSSNEFYSAGKSLISVNGSSWGTGVYIVNLAGDMGVGEFKMVLMK